MVNVGDRVFVVVGKIIVPAEIRKTYPNSKTIWWGAISNGSDGKWHTCSCRTANYFTDLLDAKIRIMDALQKERHEFLKAIDAKIAQVDMFKFEEKV